MIPNAFVIAQASITAPRGLLDEGAGLDEGHDPFKQYQEGGGSGLVNTKIADRESEVRASSNSANFACGLPLSSMLLRCCRCSTKRADAIALCLPSEATPSPGRPLRGVTRTS